MRNKAFLAFTSVIAVAAARPVTEAIGTKTGFVINNPFTYTGYTETLQQFSDAFNAQSGGCIVLTSESKRGEIDTNTFFQNITGLIRRRDPSSVSAATDQSLPMADIATVKLNRGVGPVAQTYDSFRKIGIDGSIPENHNATGIDLLDLIVGQQVAKAVQVEMINITISALVTSLRQITALKHVATGATLNTLPLVSGLAKMGDAASSNVTLWIMHSKAFYDLVANQITANIDGVTSFAVAQASPVSLNRPILVIDSPALVIANGVSAGVSSYITLGVGPGAAMAEDTENMMLATQLITGLENLSVRIQGEYAYNVGVKGFTYDVAAGGVNPSDAALATPANWDVKYADVKSLGGIIVETA
jgi:hypothetical protein